MAASKSKRYLKLAGIILVAVIGVSMINAFRLAFQPPPTPPTAEELAAQAEAERYERERVAEYQARQIIQAMMRDPSSAQFGRSFSRTKNGKVVACGYVNGRNAFGGYAGQTPWLVIMEDDLAMIRSGDNNQRFVETWNRFCSGAADD